MAVFVVLISLVVYVSMYTWNWKTGVLDRFAIVSGLEVVGSVLAPGKWVHGKIDDFWKEYVDLVGVRQENDIFQAELDALRQDNARLREDAVQSYRLAVLLDFVPPLAWERTGARIVGHRLGPNAVLQTVIIDEGIASGVVMDTPVVSPLGVVGRVHRPGYHFSTVLLLVDPNSHIPVMGATTRIPAIAVGQGAGRPLRVKYVPLSDVLGEDELLITSGLGGMFPKGLPVAKVDSVERSSLSLFQDISAVPLVNPARIEEVLVLTRENATQKNPAEPLVLENDSLVREELPR